MNLLDRVKSKLQTGLSNFQGNVQAIANPQTRNDWFSGFKQPVNNFFCFMVMI